MALYRLEDYYSNCKLPFGGYITKTTRVFAHNDEKVGTVRNFLIDGETGRFRYLTVETGLGYAGRIVLLPIGLVRVNDENESVCIPQLTKQQIESLPDLAGELGIDASYEKRIAHAYGSLIANTSSIDVGHSSTDVEPYNRNSDIYAATGSLRDYENELISQRRDECKT